MNETWQPITEVPNSMLGLFEISALGRVRSLSTKDLIGRRKPGKVLMNPRISGRYVRVRLRHHNVRIERCVHHLILEAFVGPRPDGMIGLHRDDDRTNNTVSNLRWGTYSDNRLDAFRNGTAVGAENFRGATGRRRADGSISERALAYMNRGLLI